MRRVAVIFEENIFDRKGSFNAKCARIKHLAELTGWQIDAFCIQLYQDAFVSSILGRRSLDIPGEGGISEKALRKRKSVLLNGVRLNLIWKNYSILDHFLFYKSGLRPVCYPRFLKRHADLLKGYDVVAAHSFVGGFIAREAQRRFGIPFYITWHGSDIHTTPFKHPQIKELTAELLRDAKINCFVSRDLMDVSDRIGPGNKTVLYNGCDERFVRYPEDRRAELRREFGVQGKKIVTYAGNLLPVKNPESLPGIFHEVSRLYQGGIEFWVVGDGKSRLKVEAELNADSTLECRFWGNMPPERMPEIFNCTDVLVLPSKNEGLGMVLVEAVRCGADAVASRVGGIPEVIGTENTVPLGGNFTTCMADLTVKGLNGKLRRPSVDLFDWNLTAEKERRLIDNMLSNG